MIAANDGGVDVSTDGGETWYAPRPADLAVLPRGHRHLGAVPRLRRDAGPGHRLGPEQQPLAGRHHRSATGTPSAAARPATRWPTPPTRTSSTPASTSASSPATTAAPARPATSRAWPDNPSGHGAAFPRYRFQWTAPIAISPHDPKTVYHAGNVLFRTQDGGPELDGDQRRPDPRRRRRSRDGRAARSPATTPAPSTTARSSRWPSRRARRGSSGSGSDDGLVHVTRDGGQTLDERHRERPRPARVGHGQPDRAVALRRRRSPTSWSTPTGWTTCGRTCGRRPTTAGRWKSLAAALAPDVYLHAVREDPKTEGPPLRGDRARRVVLARRRRDLEGAEAQPADGGGPRPGGEGRRPRGRHPRPLDLDPRRPHRGCASGRRRSRRRPPTCSRRARRCAGATTGPVSSQVKGPGQNPPAGAVIHYWLKDEPKATSCSRSWTRRAR